MLRLLNRSAVVLAAIMTSAIAEAQLPGSFFPLPVYANSPYAKMTCHLDAPFLGGAVDFNPSHVIAVRDDGGDGFGNSWCWICPDTITWRLLSDDCGYYTNSAAAPVDCRDWAPDESVRAIRRICEERRFDESGGVLVAGVTAESVPLTLRYDSHWRVLVVWFKVKPPPPAGTADNSRNRIDYGIRLFHFRNAPENFFGRPLPDDVVVSYTLNNARNCAPCNHPDYDTFRLSVGAGGTLERPRGKILTVHPTDPFAILPHVGGSFWINNYKRVVRNPPGSGCPFTRVTESAQLTNLMLDVPILLESDWSGVQWFATNPRVEQQYQAAGVTTGTLYPAPPPEQRTVLWSNPNLGLASLWTTDLQGNYLSHQYRRFGTWNTYQATCYAPGYDGMGRLLWSKTVGDAAIETLDSGGNVVSSAAYRNGRGAITARVYQRMEDGTGRLMWSKSTNGTAEVWELDLAGTRVRTQSFGPMAGCEATSYQAMRDGSALMLWSESSTGLAALFEIDPQGGETCRRMWVGPGAGWKATSYQKRLDGTARLVWTARNGTGARIWTLDILDEFVSSVSHGPYAGWYAESVGIQ